TSVMAFSGPGVPSKGMPKSRARAWFWPEASALANIRRTTTAQRVSAPRWERDARSVAGERTALLLSIGIKVLRIKTFQFTSDVKSGSARRQATALLSEGSNPLQDRA